MSNKHYLLAAIAALLALAACNGKNDTERILADHFKAVGQDKSTQIQTFKGVGNMSAANMDVPFTIFYKRPKKMRMELTMMGMQMATIINGDKGYVMGPNMNPQEIPAEQMKQQEASSYNMDDPLYTVKMANAKFAYLGEDTAAGQPAYKLSVITPQGDTDLAFINKQNMFLVKSIKRRTDNNVRYSMDIYYQNFKTVQGITMPYGMNMVTDYHTSADSVGRGQQVMTMKFDSIEFNDDLVDQLFEKPLVPSTEDTTPQP